MRKAFALVALALALAAPQTLFGAQATHKRTTRRKSTRRSAAAPPKANPANSNNAQPSSQTTQQPIPQVRLDDYGDAQTARASGKSEDELAAEAFSSSLNDALRKPLEGETRVVGTLSRIECIGGGLLFSVESGNRTLRLTSRGFEGLHIIAYTPQAGSQLSCGPRKIQSRAVVTYRVATDARAKTDGAIVALEFVPENFKLRQ